MKTMSRVLPADLREGIDAALRDLHGRIPAVMGCVVATVDGRLVSHIVDNDADPQRIAAMIGSMVALGETIGREVRIDRSQYVVVNASNGLLLAQRIPSERELFVLATLARPTTNLGVVLHETRTTAGVVGGQLDAWLRANAVATAPAA